MLRSLVIPPLTKGGFKRFSVLTKSKNTPRLTSKQLELLLLKFNLKINPLLLKESLILTGESKWPNNKQYIQVGPKFAYSTVDGLRKAFEEVTQNPIYDRVTNPAATKYVHSIISGAFNIKNFVGIPVSTRLGALDIIYKTFQPNFLINCKKEDSHLISRYQLLLQKSKSQSFVIIEMPCAAIILTNKKNQIPLVAAAKDFGYHLTSGNATDIVNGIAPPTQYLIKQAEQKLSATLPDKIPYMLTTSGISAISLAFEYDAKQSGTTWIQRPLYACTDDQFRHRSSQSTQTFKQYDFFQPIETINQDLNQAHKSNQLPSTIYIESSPNPLANGPINVIDLIKAIEPYKINIIIDHTFLGGIAEHSFMVKLTNNQQSLTRIIHSATKQITGGQSSSTLGAISIKPTDDIAALEKIRAEKFGLPAKTDIDILIKALDTLPKRITSIVTNNSHFYKNVKKLTKGDLPLLKDTHYSGGSVLSFEFNDDIFTPIMVEDIFNQLAKSSHYFNYAVSLGSDKTIGMVPGLATHTLLPDDIQKASNITPHLVRLSIGSSESTTSTQLIFEELKYAIGVTLSTFNLIKK